MMANRLALIALGEIAQGGILPGGAIGQGGILPGAEQVSRVSGR